MRVDELDLESVAFKMMCDGWDVREVMAAKADYLDFLRQVKKNPGKAITPSKLADRFWHAHILDTKKYQEDCKAVFGEVVHHDPHAGVGYCAVGA